MAKSDMTKDNTTSIAADIWNTLSRIDVGDKTETKEVAGVKLTYLSWAWAWGVLMEHYPNAKYRILPDKEFPNSSVRTKKDGKWSERVGPTLMVGVELEINGISREMWLPVMDARNNALINPDARSVSDSRMRCLVKAMAMFGLGHYIYAGEDVPSGESNVGQDQIVVAKEEPAQSPSEATDEKARVIFDTMFTFADGAKDVRSLNKFWTDNKGELESLKAYSPERFQELVLKFKQVKDSLKENGLG